MTQLNFLASIVALVAAILGLIPSISAITISKQTKEDLAVTNIGIDKFKETTNKEITRLRTILAVPVNNPTPPVAVAENMADIQFDKPRNFRCGANLRWSDLEDWMSFDDRRICSDSSSVYQVEGLLAPDGTKLSAEMFVPEIDKWFPASGGGIVMPNSAGHFTVNFCLQQKGPARAFTFKMIREGKMVGSECRVNIEQI